MNYVHHIPGRMRIRCAALKGNDAGAAAAKAMLASQPGVESTETNTITGGILIRYGASASPEQLLAVLRECGYTKSYAAPTRCGGAARDSQTYNAASLIAKMILSVAVEKAVERSVLAVAAALL